MGEAKSRLKLSQRIRKEQPFCIFCGGTEPSETVEHYPPRIMFDYKFRPKGLEFGACKECNEGSRHADLIAAFFARIYPDSPNESVKQETAKIIKRVVQIPGFVSEVYPERNQLGTLKRLEKVLHQIPSWDFLRIEPGPIVSKAMQIFGSKMALAMHTAVTGRVLPRSGAVAAFWYSNVDAFEGSLPQEFMQTLGPGRTLRAGTFDVANQFKVASTSDAEGTLTGHFAVFRESFGIAMFAAEDASMMKYADLAVAPGFLKKAG